MTFKRRARFAVAAWMLFGWAGAESMAATLDALAADGLYSWRVAATDDAPCWCCFDWKRGSTVNRACDLDGGNVSYGSSDAFPATIEEVQIYALVESGNVERIRVLSPQCPVTSRREVIDLGLVDADESLAWLEPRVDSPGADSSDVIAAIAMHRGNAAMKFLLDTAEGGRTMELRKDAIFWMSQARIGESAGELERLMFRDRNSEIRQHAAFSLAQSTAANRSEALIRQGREDDDPEVRSQAWFWLAQSGAGESERELKWAIANDPDDDVREEAVFAMSQLPEERAVDALLGILNDQRMHRELREKALFWLVQSDSDLAYDYLDRLFARR